MMKPTESLSARLSRVFRGPVRAGLLLVAVVVAATLAGLALSPGLAKRAGEMLASPAKAFCWLGVAALWCLALVVARRILRRTAGGGRVRAALTLVMLFVALAGWLGFGLIALGPQRGEVLSSFIFGSLPNSDTAVFALAGSLLTAGIFALSGLAWTVGAGPRVAAVALVGLAPVYVWLARDEAELRESIRLADFVASSPEAVEAEKVLLRWANGSELVRDFKSPAVWAGAKLPDIKTEAWALWVTENRSGIAAAWEEITPVRAWWAEWNRFPEVADSTQGFDFPVPSFGVIRTYARTVCAEATALALEGRGDEAIGLLVPLIEGAGKLQAQSVVLVRGMVAVVIRGMAVDTARLVLDRSGTGAESRARLRAALEPTVFGEMGARRLVAGEFALNMHFLLRMEQTGVSGDMPWLGRMARAVVLNPRRTHNEINDLAVKLMERAARRDAVAAVEVFDQHIQDMRRRSGIKNPGGLIWLDMSLPSYRYVVKNYWEKEDATQALIERLDAAPAVPPSS